ncbi:Sec-independent protein translocase protein TatB [Cognatiluteimonas weifangensis]|uniref:Sec-independent protein translocase protein TatB n=1 Tax=Cognatiluteimonas weifangensis TaxID=2303539 RepID=A0A372DHG3_9GAMM|nr:twin-arginine translocase subunit TatB [Luteimonas weifangensis]
MFDIGFSELLVIAVVALLVLGPERLPKAARLTGLWVRRARAQWHAVRAELERDLAAEDLRRSLHDTQAAMREAQAALREAGDDAQRALEPDTRMRDDAPPTAAPPSPPTEPRPGAPADDDARGG